MKTIRHCAIMCMLLASCAPRPEYTKPGVDAATLQLDHEGCAYEARKATASNPDWTAAASWSQLEQLCMAAKGYTNIAR